MRTRFVPVLLALACSLLLVAGARAAPRANIWESTYHKIWPRDGSGVAQDTLPRFGALGSGDSVVVSDSINVMGARYIVLMAIGSGVDTLTAFQLQSKLPGQTAWAGAGGINNLPYSAFTAATLNSNGVSGATRCVWGVYNEPTTQGSTPLPMVNTYFRWRFKSADTRRYTLANGLGLAPTGSIQIFALVWR